MKVLVHDGIGVWQAARRLNSGKFAWPKAVAGALTLTRAQLDALPALAAPLRGWSSWGVKDVLALAIARKRGGQVQQSDKGTPDERCANMSPDELEELEAAIAEDEAGEVISGEYFLHSLRSPLDSFRSR